MDKLLSPELMIGTDIDIRRTDGRMHSAIISSIDVVSSIITVEWFERGEAKGKEIEVSEILHLNPHFSIERKKKLAKSCDEIDESVSDSFEMSKKHNLEMKTLKDSGQFSKSMIISVDKSCENKTQENNVTSSTSEISTKSVVISTKKFTDRSRRLTCVDEIKKNKKRRSNNIPIPKPFNTDNPIENDQQTDSEKLPSINVIDIPVHLSKKVTVFVRKRPMNIKEIENKEIDIITVKMPNSVVIRGKTMKNELTSSFENHSFKYDYVFDDSTSNENVYNYSVKPIIQNIFCRTNNVCFAYGHTGSGKSYTIHGRLQPEMNQKKIHGISLLAVEDVIDIRNKKVTENFQIEISYFEVFNGKVFDLLNRREKVNVKKKEGQFEMVDLMYEKVDTLEDVRDFLMIGNDLRLNEKSNRTHVVFQIILKTENENIGKLSLVEMAGSEMVQVTQPTQRNRMESADIERSFWSLKECFKVVNKNESNIKFKDSKLTMLLGDSLHRENCYICVIAMISPQLSAYGQSLDTLTFASELMRNDGSSESRMKDKRHVGFQKRIVDLNKEKRLKQYDINDNIFLQEDDVVHAHESLIKEHLLSWNKSHRQIYKFSKKVDYNMDAYTQNLETLINSQINFVTTLKDKVRNLKELLNDEEDLNKQ